MREILFRGLNYVAGEYKWVYGDLIRYQRTGTQYIQEEGSSTLRLVNPESIGQYTGLLDKNGKRIFEGDVLLERYKEPDCDGREGILAEVVFHKGAFMIKEPGEDPEYTLGETYEDFEVVGNVFENAELLEVE